MQDLLLHQREFFHSRATQDVSVRRAVLDRLLAELRKRRDDICAALADDLGKSPCEAMMTEYLPTMQILKLMRRKLKCWSRPHRVPTALFNFPSTGYLAAEPYGVVLIVSAWNYPFLLAMEPLIGAVAAGNCVILRPAPAAAMTATLLTNIVKTCFAPEYVTTTDGEPDALAQQNFDYIFFTGGAEMGRKVMAGAARNLVPVTLELGGKSPCVVAADADLDIAARRIVWGKFLNAGQTCVAPDYLLVHRQVKDALVVKMRRAIIDFYGANPQESPDFGRIVNEWHYQRLSRLLADGRLVAGGEREAKAHYIAPTIVDQVTWSDPVMQQEIFGPILPVLEFETMDEAIEAINRRPKPLALYFFSRSRAEQRRMVRETSSGAVCCNDTVMHLMNPAMPFGGVGESGMGAYHGQRTFTTFSHMKPVMRRSNRLDWPLRYPPFGSWLLKLLERLAR